MHNDGTSSSETELFERVEAMPIQEQASIWEHPDAEDVRGSIPLSSDDAVRPRVLAKAELLARPRYPRYKLPGAEMGGYGRVAYTGLRASNAQMGMLFCPIGQGSPPHTAGTEHLIMVLEGEMIFTIGGREHRVSAWDQIFLPADQLYTYRNGGSVGAWMCNVTARHQEWPGNRGQYEAEEVVAPS